MKIGERDGITFAQLTDGRYRCEFYLCDGVWLSTIKESYEEVLNIEDGEQFLWSAKKEEDAHYTTPQKVDSFSLKDL